MISLTTETDRTVFFDFVPESLGEIRGFKVRFHLYTVPGKVTYEASQKLILKGVDGVVFVADSDPAHTEETLASWDGLKANLAELGYDWTTMPFVVQFDRRDHPQAVDLESLKKHLGLTHQPGFEAVASKGVGVFDTLKAIAKQVLLALKAGAESTSKAKISQSQGEKALRASFYLNTVPTLIELVDDMQEGLLNSIHLSTAPTGTSPNAG
jgi:signal recognition particle receptor subunit beta